MDPALTPATGAPNGRVSNLVDPTNVGSRITITNIICIIFFMMVVSVRLFTRVFLNRSFGHDDSLIIFSTVCFLAVMGVFQWMVSSGLGKHLWDVSVADYSPDFLHAWLIAAVLYAAAMLTMKLSVLMLYRRLFPIQNFNIQWFVAVFFVISYSLAFIIASIFSCDPISATWDDSVRDAKCINRTGLYIAYTVMNSLSTWWILLMPMPIVWGLALKNDQKTLLSGLFALGCLPCVTSIARLVVLVNWLQAGHNSKDITWTLWPIVLWTQLELTVCMICACGPTLRTFVDRQIKSIRTVTSNRSWTPSWSKSYSKSYSGTPSNPISYTSQLSSLPKARLGSQSSNRSNLIEMLQGRTSKSKTLVTSNELGLETASMEHIVYSSDYARASPPPTSQGIMVHTSYQVRTINESV